METMLQELGGIAFLSLALKLLLIPSYTSTDFEVHRNWLALTHSLPPAQWYHEATSQWTLDYPPCFAWFEYVLSLLAAKIDVLLVTISSKPIFTTRILFFQRVSVICTEFLLFYAVYEFASSLPTAGKAGASKKKAHAKQKKQHVIITSVLLTLFDAGLLFVDHIHFQYNGMLLGLLILSAARFMQQKMLHGAALYAILLMFKHIYLYAAPLYFVYLLRGFCFVPVVKKKKNSSAARGFSMVRFVQLGLLVLVIFGVAFGSILLHHPNPLNGVKQMFSRMFPVQRGLCHAYWAPNVWALYAFVDKLLVLSGRIPGSNGHEVASMSGGLVQEAKFAVLPTISPLVCAVLAFGAMLLVLVSVWTNPKPGVFMRALVYCMHCSFMFGYHVHEKAILQVTLPLALLATQGDREKRLYRLSSWISTLSLFPLLFTPQEQVTKVLLFAVHALMTHCLLEKKPKNSAKLDEATRGCRRCWIVCLEQVYMAVVAVVVFGATAFTWIPNRIVTKYPFLPLMAISVSCAVGNVYVLLQALVVHWRHLIHEEQYQGPSSGDKKTH